MNGKVELHETDVPSEQFDSLRGGIVNINNSNESTSLAKLPKNSISISKAQRQTLNFAGLDISGQRFPLPVIRNPDSCDNHRKFVCYSLEEETINLVYKKICYYIKKL